jgi:hypothetical protein
MIHGVGLIIRAADGGREATIAMNRAVYLIIRCKPVLAGNLHAVKLGNSVFHEAAAESGCKSRLDADRLN